MTARAVNPGIERVRHNAKNLHLNGNRTEVTESPEKIESVPSQFSDDAIALAFSARYAETLRRTEAWGKWHERDAHRWKEDTTLRVYDQVRHLCRELAEFAPEKLRSEIMSGRKVASVERLARSDQRHLATPDMWDSDPFLLGTPGGVVDLRTGDLRPGTSNDYITKLTAVAPSGDCPRFLEFLAWAAAYDSELFAYLKRLFGYCLTGRIQEHALPFFCGPGGNGKSTLLNTVAGLMGDYHEVAPMDAFTESRGERHPTDLAGLRGARMVTAQETERGRRWATLRVKAITGGDPIRARLMRQDFFTYVPEFKLIVAANDKPSIDSVDEAMRRRFHLIPFEQSISDDAKDESLPDKLREEWPGILAWMIEGCLEWQEQGLRPPQRVTDATAAYLTAEDSYGAWIEEACSIGDRQWDSSATLYSSWATFAKRAGEDPGTRKAFAKELSKRGFASAKNSTGNIRGFRGLSVLADTVNAYHTHD